MRSLLLLAFGLLGALAGHRSALAQVTAPVNGPHDRNVPVHAFVHATVHPAPGRTLYDATVVVSGDRITAVGQGVSVPKDAVVHDLHGAHVWPGFVEPYGDLGMPKEAPAPARTPAGAHHWNPAVRATQRAATRYAPDAEQAARLRAQGVTAVWVHQADGIVRGTGAVVLPAGRSPQLDVLVTDASAHFSFQKGSSTDPYPSSLTGSIALFRQTLLDARWYADGGAADLRDAELEALAAQQRLPWVFEARDRDDVLRIAALGREHGFRAIVRGGGDEYARWPEVAAAGLDLILPVVQPDAPDVRDPHDATEVPIARLKHWELAPHGPRILHEAGVRFAFTRQGLKEPEDWWPALRRLVRCGLDSSAAIAACTTVPAAYLGLEDRLGVLATGALANLLITTDHLLAEDNSVQETWVAGERFVHTDRGLADVRGTYDLNIDGRTLRLEVSGGRWRDRKAVLRGAAGDTVKYATDLTHTGERIGLRFDAKAIGRAGDVRLNGTVHADGAIWDGQGVIPGDTWAPWSAVRRIDAGPVKEPAARRSALDSLLASAPGDVWAPFSAYGDTLVPDSVTLLFKGATVWTNTAQGVLRNADVLVHQGRVAAVGTALDPYTVLTGRSRPVVREVDARGLHLTPGIVDEHSHIALRRGVNEGGQAISAEVRMTDVIDADDVDIYRQLAGGVTAAQLLHGSANPIGGQSALVKLRWGLPADAFPIDRAQGFIKFALGENVKQSTSPNGKRYPRTRMGVEQLMLDAFLRARDHRVLHDAHAAATAKAGSRRKRNTTVAAPRRDLELEALGEILRGERFISCHSYVQSEIEMLMDLADSLGFTVNTFTHILEGYKMAARMREHGVAASTFSDWWAYKWEVYEAIPYNAALLWQAGVLTGINSDDAEMGRRLNQEAAKAVKYGGVPEEEALKMVTFNPARMLRLDHRMGSVEPGKDADLVLWSAHPLSIDARAEMTLVDGRPLYERARDERLRTALRAERDRLTGKVLAAQRLGARTESPAPRKDGHWHCETIGEEP
ncbi:MAG: amidohydrolase family protein [Flavobacteriales bacterium]|nr:amidohydrolase family protein [Flavobacteriales bacterium]